MQITGIILAGGKSKRMGTDKAFIKLNSKTLLEHSVELLQPFCKSILIGSNNPEHKFAGTKTITDKIPDCGPIGGVYSCLKESETDWNFVISVDSASVKLQFVKYLIDDFDDFDAVVPIHSKGKEPLIALYNKNCLFELRKMIQSGDFKMHNLLNSINTKWVDSQNWVEKHPKLFHNINRPEDLKR
ncbi:MAG: molybdenum cofactor guanylyltransferase [Draconibacterium sp.]|nr:molybdenum cofactor guanylyltransferase [Draconibacterium sp.]